MGLVSLLFSFNGRINRLQFWLGSIGAGVVGGALLGAVMVSTGMSIATAKTPEAAVQALGTLGLIIIPLSMVMSWCGLALQFKRFHDRGRTGFLAFLPMAVMIPMMGTIISGALASQPAEVVAASAQPYVTVLWLINLAFFIDLGCLGSVEGPNKYGDPPGAPRSSAPLAPMQPAGGASAAASTLFGAQSAMDRAIAERARQATAPAPSPRLAATGLRTGMPTPAPAGGASFGRRTAR